MREKRKQRVKIRIPVSKKANRTIPSEKELAEDRERNKTNTQLIREYMEEIEGDGEEDGYK